MPYNVIFTERYLAQVEHLRQSLEEAHHAWWKEWKAQQPDFKIENIRFAHNPRWRSRFWSIQSARDGGHWIWKATKVFMMGTGQVI